MTDLKPCPFCGGEAELFKGKLGFWHVKCGGRPECGVLPLTNSASTEAEAIAAWNTRADSEYEAVPATDENMAKYGWVRERTCRSIDPTDSREFFICSNCNFGAGRVEFIPNYCPNCGAKVVDE